MMMGRIDEVDGHYVATRFVAFLLPVECLYVARDGRTTMSGRGSDLRIQTDWRSVMLAYGRVWLPILAAALPVVVYLTTHTVPIAVLVLSVLMVVVAVLTRRSGELSEREKARLRLLGTVTGLRIDPSKLLPTTREVKRESLRELMEKGGIPTTPAEILSVLDDIPMPAMPLVYGFACYAGDDPEWRECAQQVYLRHEQGDI